MDVGFHQLEDQRENAEQNYRETHKTLMVIIYIGNGIHKILYIALCNINTYLHSLFYLEVAGGHALVLLPTSTLAPDAPMAARCLPMRRAVSCRFAVMFP